MCAQYTKTTNVSSRTQINQQQQAWGEKGTDNYGNAHIRMVAMEFSRRWEQEPSTSRTFGSLNLLDQNRTRQIKLLSVIIQSVLCEVACEVKSTEDLLVFARTEVWAENSEQAVIILYQLSVNSGTKIVRTINILTESKYFVFTLFSINELIF